jgi:hypothetical protein
VTLPAENSTGASAEYDGAAENLHLHKLSDRDRLLIYKAGLTVIFQSWAVKYSRTEEVVWSLWHQCPDLQFVERVLVGQHGFIERMLSEVESYPFRRS